MRSPLVFALIALFAATSLLTAGIACTTQQEASGVTAVQTFETAYYNRLQANIDAMPAGTAKTQAQAKLTASKSQDDLILLGVELGVTLLPQPATQPATVPAGK